MKGGVGLTGTHLFRSSRKVRENVGAIVLQDAQLSQRDRAAGCVIVLAKSERLELGDNILRKVTTVI